MASLLVYHDTLLIVLFIILSIGRHDTSWHTAFGSVDTGLILQLALDSIRA